MKQFSLKGKVALVTGGSRGIGKAVALGLAEAGADVAVASRKLPDLELVSGEVKKLGRRSLAVAAHVGKLDEITSLVARVKEELGRIDILVNNAAANPTPDSALDIQERAWDVTMNLNVKGLFFLSQAVARLMKEQGGGNIITISSVEGIHPDILPVYSISKAGAIMATKVMAKEWAKYHIRANVIAPGLVKTDFSKYLWNTPDICRDWVTRTPLGRIAEAHEMVGAAIYLASDASMFVTGQILVVDGGLTI